MKSKLETLSTGVNRRFRGSARTRGCTGSARWSKGFTLIELMVVIAIMAILAGLVFGAMTGMTKSSKRKKAKTQIDVVELALEMYRQEFGTFPVSEADPEEDPEIGAHILYQALSGDGNDQLQAAGDPLPSIGELGSTHKAFMEQLDPQRNAFRMLRIETGGRAILIDPWDQPFRYRCFEKPVDRRDNQNNPASYDLYTHGATVEGEMLDEDEDVDSTKKWVTNWD